MLQLTKCSLRFFFIKKVLYILRFKATFYELYRKIFAGLLVWQLNTVLLKKVLMLVCLKIYAFAHFADTIRFFP